MILLYSVPIGFLVGLLVGGRLRGLADLTFRFTPVALVGLLVQVVLFDPRVTSWIGDAGPVIYVGSTTAVLAAVLANLRTRGMPLVAAGSASNLLAIVANGGYMPANAAAYASQGRTAAEVYSNTRIMDQPAFAILTDIIPLPGWIPFANVVSIGDLLIALGVVAVIAFAMRGPRMLVTPDTERDRPGLPGHPCRDRADRTVRPRTAFVLRRSSLSGQTRREAGTQSQGSAGLPITGPGRSRRPPGRR